MTTIVEMFADPTGAGYGCQEFIQRVLANSLGFNTKEVSLDDISGVTRDRREDGVKPILTGMLENGELYMSLYSFNGELLLEEVAPIEEHGFGPFFEFYRN